MSAERHPFLSHVIDSSEQLSSFVERVKSWQKAAFKTVSDSTLPSHS